MIYPLEFKVEPREAFSPSITPIKCSLRSWYHKIATRLLECKNKKQAVEELENEEVSGHGSGDTNSE